MNETGLTHKVFKSLTWVGSASLFSQILSWAITIVIVRQLTPDDFGLMAMAAVFWGFLTMIGDFGLFASIVQNKEITAEQLREISGFIVILNLLFLITTYLAAPVISDYFTEPRLTAILRTLCLVFLFIPFYVIPHSLLLREMNFRITSIIDVFCNLSAAITSLVFALNGYGVWSLVYGTLVQFLSRAVSFSLVSRTYHKPLFQLTEIRRMLSFSSFFTGGTILRYFFFRSDIIIGGKFIGPEALGIYSIANQLAFMPVEKMSNIIPQVAFPAFSKLQLDVKAYAANFLKGMKLLNLLFIPSYIVIFILAEDIVDVLLGSKWSAIVTPMRILCLVMPLRAFEVLFIPAMNGLGKSNITMMTSGVSLIIMVSAFFVGIHWGYVGLCWAWVVGFIVIFFITISICINILKVDVAALAATYKTAVIAGAGLLILGAVFMYDGSRSVSPVMRIVIFLAGSFVLYSISIMMLDKQIIIYVKTVLGRRKAE